MPAAGFLGDRLKTDANEERVEVTLEPIGTETDVVLTTAVLGLPMEATATVKTAGADIGITPHGQIKFVVRNGSGVYIYTGFANLGDDGIATLAEALPAPNILVDTVGHWTVEATYTQVRHRHAVRGHRRVQVRFRGRRSPAAWSSRSRHRRRHHSDRPSSCT